MSSPRAVFIGASAGGVSAIQKLLESVGEFSLPMIIVQHLPSDAQVLPDLVFGRCSKGKVFEAEDKTPIQPGNVYFAAPGYHLLVEKDFTLSLSQDEPVQFSRPSIDVLFETAAEAYGPNACGIVLTGANSDGARGLKCIHDSGGYTMVQSPEKAEVSTMPSAALQMSKVDFVGDIPSIAQRLIELQKAAAI